MCPLLCVLCVVGAVVVVADDVFDVCICLMFVLCLMFCSPLIVDTDAFDDGYVCLWYVSDVCVCCE